MADTKTIRTALMVHKSMLECGEEPSKVTDAFYDRAMQDLSQIDELIAAARRLILKFDDPQTQIASDIVQQVERLRSCLQPGGHDAN